MEKNIPLFDLSSFKYNTNYALEASAGTGKTYSIKEMVKQLVLIHHLPLDKILIVTYTEKAAGELKDRIRDVLTSPLKELGGKSVKEVVGDTINCDVDNAFIGTIHSFCKNTIKEFAFSINKPFNLALAESDTINQYANKFIREGNILEDITRLLDYPFIIKEDFLIKKFISLMEHYYLNDKGEEDPSIISYLPSYEDDPLDKSIGLKLLLSKEPIKELKALDINLYSDYELLKSSSHPNVIQFIEDFEDYAKFINSKDGVSKYKIEINKGCTRDEQAAYKHLFALKKEVQDFDQHNYLIDKYLKDFYLGYLKYKEDNRLQTFNDMLRIVRESVLEKDSKLLKCLKDKYTYAIIDEFQDTNQIQFDIFKEVFMSIDHHIIVVGDPKQSIYSYQGADVTVYQKAVELISKTGMKCRLGKNHRSYSGVVSFGNELFKHYPFASSFEPSLYRSIEQGDDSERRLIYKGQYSPALMMNETPLDPDSYAKFAITLILDFVDKPDGKNTNLQLVTVNKEGQEKMRNVSFLDFVVLGRSRSELAIMQTALKKAGIPALRYKDNTLFSGIECLQWISLLEAIDVVDFTGYNRGYFKKALFTKFFNLSIKEISDDKYDEDDNEPYRLLEGWRHLAKEGLWQDLFDRIIEESNIDKHMPELDQLQSLSAFKQLGNYCVDYLFEGHNIKELINNLIEVSDAARNDLDSSALIEKSTEFNAVRLMTMHASKGLQFPVVISMGGAKGLPPSADSYSCHHLLKSGDIGYVTSINKLKEVNEETNGESTRLFYVAYTRSEYLLIAPKYEGNPKFKEIEEAMDKFINNTASKTFNVNNIPVEYYKLLPFIDVEYSDLLKKSEDILFSLHPEKEDENKENEQKKLLKKLIKDKKDKLSYKHSYSSLAHPQGEEENKEEFFDDEFIIDKEGNNDELISAYDKSGKQIEGIYDDNVEVLEIPEGYPKGASLGNALHEIFERLDFTNYQYNYEQIIIDRFIYNGFDITAKPEWLEYTKNIVETVLSASLIKIKGKDKLEGTFKLSEINNDNKKPEIEFNFNYPNEIMKNYLNGFIDLLFKQGDVYSILDWKSDTLSDEFLSYSDKEQLKGQVDRRYAIQRVLYSYCLINWLKQYYNESEEEIFNNHFGGIYYVFIRGCHKDTSNGVYTQTWNSYDDLKKEFLNIINDKRKEK